MRIFLPHKYMDTHSQIPSTPYSTSPRIPSAHTLLALGELKSIQLPSPLSAMPLDQRFCFEGPFEMGS